MYFVFDRLSGRELSRHHTLYAAAAAECRWVATHVGSARGDRDLLTVVVDGDGYVIGVGHPAYDLLERARRLAWGE